MMTDSCFYICVIWGISFHINCIFVCVFAVIVRTLTIFILLEQLIVELLAWWLFLDMKPDQWERMKRENNWNDIELRDGRYNQVIHMVSAAKGAEDFYQLDTHATRHESMDLARQLDDLTSQVSK